MLFFSRIILGFKYWNKHNNWGKINEAIALFYMPTSSIPMYPVPFAMIRILIFNSTSSPAKFLEILEKKSETFRRNFYTWA
jgi:hypothetical protein